jgi:hypothetical protein
MTSAWGPMFNEDQALVLDLAMILDEADLPDEALGLRVEVMRLHYIAQGMSPELARTLCDGGAEVLRRQRREVEQRREMGVRPC